MTTNYHQAITHLLDQEQDARGITLNELARDFGMDSGHYLSMVKSAKHGPGLSLSHLPKLSQMRGLSGRESLRLALLRSRLHGVGDMDHASFVHLLKLAVDMGRTLGPTK